MLNTWSQSWIIKRIQEGGVAKKLKLLWDNGYIGWHAFQNVVKDDCHMVKEYVHQNHLENKEWKLPAKSEGISWTRLFMKGLTKQLVLVSWNASMKTDLGIGSQKLLSRKNFFCWLKRTLTRLMTTERAQRV